jgi:hypothetical protein
MSISKFVATVGRKWDNLFPRTKLMENENCVCNCGPTGGVITKSQGMGLPMRTSHISKDNIQTGLEEIQTHNAN